MKTQNKFTPTLLPKKVSREAVCRTWLAGAKQKAGPYFAPVTDTAVGYALADRYNEHAELLAALEDSADAIDAVIVNIEGGAKDALREINRRNRETIAKARGAK